jgi:putative FmdB family regulatory protein
MPIYAYRCADCGHTKDVLQKLSDPVLTTCPACGKETFSKQLTAAGFQLKGSGWYVTDFRNNGSSGAAKSSTSSSESKPEPAKAESSASAGGGDAAGCGTACACH